MPRKYLNFPSKRNRLMKLAVVFSSFYQLFIFSYLICCFLAVFVILFLLDQNKSWLFMRQTVIDKGKKTKNIHDHLTFVSKLY